MKSMNKCVIIGGGTFNPIACHLALAAPAFGQTARDMGRWFPDITCDMECVVKLTKMADHTSNLMTNDDVAAYVRDLLGDPLVKIIVLNAAICDFGIENPSEEARLSSQKDYPVVMKGITNKIIRGIKSFRPDIVVCGFKTTHSATRIEQRIRAIESYDSNNLDFLIANDLGTRVNMLVSEHAIEYGERGHLLRQMLSGAVHHVVD
jgi:hypothetical protein